MTIILESDEEKEAAMELLTKVIITGVGSALRFTLKDTKRTPSEQCSAVIEGSSIATLRHVVGMGVSWNDAIHFMRKHLDWLEQMHVEAVREQMEAKVGAVTPTDVPEKLLAETEALLDSKQEP